MGRKRSPSHVAAPTRSFIMAFIAEKYEVETMNGLPPFQLKVTELTDESCYAELWIFGAKHEAVFSLDDCNRKARVFEAKIREWIMPLLPSIEELRKRYNV